MEFSEAKEKTHTDPWFRVLERFIPNCRGLAVLLCEMMMNAEEFARVIKDILYYDETNFFRVYLTEKEAELIMDENDQKNTSYSFRCKNSGLQPFYFGTVVMGHLAASLKRANHLASFSNSPSVTWEFFQIPRDLRVFFVIYCLSLYRKNQQHKKGRGDILLPLIRLVGFFGVKAAGPKKKLFADARTIIFSDNVQILTKALFELMRFLQPPEDIGIEKYSPKKFKLLVDLLHTATKHFCFLPRIAKQYLPSFAGFPDGSIDLLRFERHHQAVAKLGIAFPTFDKTSGTHPPDRNAFWGAMLCPSKPYKYSEKTNEALNRQIETFNMRLCRQNGMLELSPNTLWITFCRGIAECCYGSSKLLNLWWQWSSLSSSSDQKEEEGKKKIRMNSYRRSIFQALDKKKATTARGKEEEKEKKNMEFLIVTPPFIFLKEAAVVVRAFTNI